MSVIIRLQNLPWSANALDIRNFFRGLSIPEGGVHIVGGELGDAFIAFSTDEDARQAMMLDGGKIKEIQVKLLLSSRSEMHKVIEAARQSVPILSLTAPAVVPAPAVVAPPVIPAPVVTAPSVQAPPAVSPFSTALNSSLSSFGIPGIGNPQEIPQPAVIEPPAPLISPPIITTPEEVLDKDDDRQERKRSKEKDRRRTRSRSRSRDRDRKDRKRDRRDRSRSRERRRRDRSRSRDRRDRGKRDRKDRSRSRDRSSSIRSRDRRINNDRKSPPNEKPFEPDVNNAPPPPSFGNISNQNPNIPPIIQSNLMPNLPMNQIVQSDQNRFNSDPSIADAYNKLQELGKKRNPNAFQGDQQNNGDRMQQGGRGGGLIGRGGASFRRDGRGRFENSNVPQRDCCVAIRNAPNHTSYGDVRRFFPFMIDKHGIKMINDNMGRRTGNIFVRFCDSRSKHLALQRKNNELKGAEVIVEALEDDVYEGAVDSYLPYRDDNGEEESALIMPAQEEVQLPSFTVIKLTDLPHFVKEHDIIKTFSDFSLLSIMLNDDRATRSKIAFVQFAKPEDAKQVYDQKAKYVFGRRNPTMTPILDDEHDREKALQNERMSVGGARTEPTEPREVEPQEPARQEREPVIPRDPRQRRPPFDNASQGVSIPQPQGPAFFGSPFPQAQPFPSPFQTPAASFSGFPAAGIDPRTAAANWANRPSFPNQVSQVQNNRVPDLENEPLDCVLMKGLPREATDRTIVTFLSDTGAVPARIHLMLDGSGLPSGDCFCEFRSVQEARMAITKHGQNLDGCRITVDLVTRSVVEEALEGPKQAEIRGDGILGNAPQFFDTPRGGFAPRGGFRGRGGYDRGGYDRGGFRGGFGSGRGEFDSGRGGFDSGRGGFDSGRNSFDSVRGSFDSVRGGFDSGRGGFDSSRGGAFRGRGFLDRDRGGRGFDRGRGRGFGRGRGVGAYENGRHDIPEEPESALEDFGAPGCVVSMENVPFRATVDDILQFFADFELTQDDVIRRYNERGQPTGDARVAFRTPFDAQRAVNTRHMDTIQDRRINLTIL